MAEEIIEPEKTIPKALILTTTFTAFASVAVGVITLDVLGIGTLVSGEFARPVIAVLQEMGFSQWIILGANLGIVISFLGNAAGGVIGNPRLLMALSRDKLFIEQFADIHPRYQTPYRGVLIQTIVAILVVLLAAGNYQRLLELVVVPSIILYALMMFLVPYFRFKKKQTQRPYRAPFGAFLPLVLVIGYLGMLLLWAFYNPDAGIWMWYNAQAITQLRLLGSFMLFSIPIYLLLTYFYNPDVLINTVNKFALVNLVFEDILVPRRVRRRVLEILDESRGKHIVEIGCGVGSLTMHLADHVGSDGVVYAIDFSNHNTRIAEKRILKKGHTHVKVIHDPHLVNRIHPDVQNADIVVSIGNLSYLQDVPRILKEMYSLLSPRGKICFVEYVDFFWFLPNSPKWLSHHDEIRRLFSEAGFAINVEVKRGLFWKYLYIYGFKERSGVPYI